MSDKGFFASICSFFKGLFSSDNDSCCKPESKAAASAPTKANDGLTGVERYIRAQSNGGSSLTGVEKYIRNQLATNKPMTGVEKYIRSKANAAPLTGVERYIRSKA
ncbi:MULTISPECIES: hypothetical protein [unclassified Methylophaga]|jgi:hypothetical protein|uniref:hypothetical protein n=1 Tax=unclassified Methylophaga TaxID=2629249 RepID=UPI000C9398CB|nr:MULTISPECIES: hypothetical protein [unclassified Methylophaga]MAK67935.1 hypothetical protein [Methylophaga sp.]MAY16710.1 hypothetical protein [Methylophaga sp.]MBN46862.1 hypothetical protein [Methylophaga sp.]|tara:strand:+ start:256 stop:573 length:318 start_codon:yes stop_codon:yes gene_type:complete